MSILYQLLKQTAATHEPPHGNPFCEITLFARSGEVFVHVGGNQVAKGSSEDELIKNLSLYIENMACHGESRQRKEHLEGGVTAIINERYCIVHGWQELGFSGTWIHDLCGTLEERRQGELAENLKRAA